MKITLSRRNAVSDILKMRLFAVSGLLFISLAFSANTLEAVTPSKAIRDNKTSNLDAATVARYVVNFAALDDTQRIAADVTGNGTITSLDAAYFARNAAFPNFWLFPEKKIFEQTGASKQSRNAAALITVTAPAAQFATINTNFTVTLSSSETTGTGNEAVLSYQFDLIYNQSVIVPQATPCETTGTNTSGHSFFCNANTAGLIKVVVFGQDAFSGSGALFKFKFHAVGAAGTNSPLTIQNFMFNEGSPMDATTNGSIVLVGPTAASVSVAGRLLSATGNGVGKASVALTNSRGETRTALSTSFGYYRFDDLSAGETYILSVSSKRYVFTPQAFGAFEGVTELNLIAEP